eukprot:TRINITY_DN3359_c0_g1_i2.p1 TRINITY_DN3359_c0_g1~~TRINITY_DN3359_c0_g1_i2.p1  ORF type:complete len:689 (-),score=135.19 TRINITY_DN3359_c0_g1_i2:1-2067(-)
MPRNNSDKPKKKSDKNPRKLKKADHLHEFPDLFDFDSAHPDSNWPHSYEEDRDPPEDLKGVLNLRDLSTSPSTIRGIFYMSSMYNDINKKSGGSTQLHRACKRGETEKVRNLLLLGADVNIKDDENETALLVALRYLKTDLVCILLDYYDTDFDVKDAQQNTPLHLILINFEAQGFKELFPLILAKTSDINAKNEKGNTPLLLAIHDRNYYAAQVLLQAGANINAPNNHRETPLRWACIIAHEEVVQLCLSHGADTDVTDRTGNTPLHHAAHSGQKEICEMLVENGANLRIKNHQGQIPLDMCSNPVVRKLLEDYDPRSKSWKSMIDISEVEVNFKAKTIGEGQFGKCYKGYLHGTPVAVKVLKVSTMSDYVIQSFHHEVGVAADIRHPNVVLFLGASVCLNESTLCIITEYLPQGSLRCLLNNHFSAEEVPWILLKRLATTTARGLAWLHSRRPVVLHRDLHSGNILITDTFECKVGDFGMSEIQGEIQTQPLIMYRRIIAPEVRNREQPFNKKSDVFSFGLVLYELLFPNRKATHILANSLPEILEDGQKTRRPYQADMLLDYIHWNLAGILHRRDLIVQIQGACAFDPKDRPSFEEILEPLEKMKERPLGQSARRTCDDGFSVEKLKSSLTSSYSAPHLVLQDPSKELALCNGYNHNWCEEPFLLDEDEEVIGHYSTTNFEFDDF